MAKLVAGRGQQGRRCHADRIVMSLNSSAAVRDGGLLLPDSTRMDAVTLRTADLDLMSNYYQRALGLTVLSTESTTTAVGADRRTPRIVLGRKSQPLLVLVATPGLPQPLPGQAGLFHTALVFPDQAALAKVLASTARHPLSRYVGAADHLVSEAFYFTDPEGNGIELYRDRPRGSWTWHGSRVTMGSLPLDPHRFLRDHLEAEGAPDSGAAHVGHVHLKVGDIDSARRFYAEILGFSITLDVGTALFVSAGGYHHHLGLNTWESAGAGPRAATIGLGQVAVTVSDEEALQALAERLRRHGVAFADDGRTLRFADPWNSLLEVSVGG